MRSTLLFLALLPSMLFAQQFEWGQAFGGNQNDNAQRISPGPGGSIFVVGNFIGPATIGGNTLQGYGFQDVYLARYSSTGQLDWAKAIGGSGQIKFLLLKQIWMEMFGFQGVSLEAWI